MPSHPRSAWVRLGELLVRRRIELDPRYSNRRIFTDERIPGKYRIINTLERGQRDTYETGTIAAIEAAYDLAPGAIGRFLDGGELETQERPDVTEEMRREAPPPRPERPGLLRDMPPEFAEPARPYLRDLLVLVAAAELHNPGGTLAGADVFPGDPDGRSARQWDLLAAKGHRSLPDGFTNDEIAEALALAWSMGPARQGEAAAGLAAASR